MANEIVPGVDLAVPDVFEKAGTSGEKLQVTRIPPPVVVQYDLLTLRRQEARIVLDVARCTNELAEVRNLIAQATALGVADPTAEK